MFICVVRIYFYQRYSVPQLLPLFHILKDLKPHLYRYIKRPRQFIKKDNGKNRTLYFGKGESRYRHFVQVN